MKTLDRRIRRTVVMVATLLALAPALSVIPAAGAQPPPLPGPWFPPPDDEWFDGPPPPDADWWRDGPDDRDQWDDRRWRDGPDDRPWGDGPPEDRGWHQGPPPPGFFPPHP
ncbi:hypothetical protein [Nocardia sp. BMG111209]|uniref:hypothetical protein n=1 Tax=Nocardia sp. BMG111209 TaxID=1160137 RepID=UPI000381CD06|nr:hypothetical protein [Nocardia sp. BMG111209]